MSDVKEKGGPMMPGAFRLLVPGTGNVTTLNGVPRSCVASVAARRFDLPEGLDVGFDVSG